MNWLERARRRSVVTNSGCWEFIGARHNKGYGCMTVDGRTQKLHRLSAQAFVPGFDPSLIVMHKCDNPPCWNPDHLALGSIADNQRDMVEKGRSARGTRNGHAKVTEAQVSEIRRRLAAGERQTDLASEYGIGLPAMHEIASRNHWRHVA